MIEQNRLKIRIQRPELHLEWLLRSQLQRVHGFCDTLLISHWLPSLANPTILVSVIFRFISSPPHLKM